MQVNGFFGSVLVVVVGGVLSALAIGYFSREPKPTATIVVMDEKSPPLVDAFACYSKVMSAVADGKERISLQFSELPYACRDHMSWSTSNVYGNRLAKIEIKNTTLETIAEIEIIVESSRTAVAIVGDDVIPFDRITPSAPLKFDRLLPGRHIILYFDRVNWFDIDSSILISIDGKKVEIEGRPIIESTTISFIYNNLIPLAFGVFITVFCIIGAIVYFITKEIMRSANAELAAHNLRLIEGKGAFQIVAAQSPPVPKQ